MNKYYKFTDRFATSEDFIKAAKSLFGEENELFTDENWYTKKADIVFEWFYNFIKGKTVNKYFIWSDEILDDKIQLFFLAIFNPIYNFYRKQLPYASNELNLLKDKKNRGSMLDGNTNQAATSYSQPTTKGIEWDNENDAPSNKSGTKRNMNTSNINSDIIKITNTRLTVFYSDIWMPIHHMFISYRYIKPEERITNG